MRGMILAAGRGERMGQHTQNMPKPLLKVKNFYLIEYAIFALIHAGIKEIVINVCYHKEQIKKIIGNGARYGVSILYSEEQEALETGGGILQALPLLGTEPFIALSSDIITTFDLRKLLQPKDLAHIVLVDNPIYHPTGDFCIDENNTITLGRTNAYTFANIGIYKPELFANCQPGKFGLGNLLRTAITQHQITGEHFNGFWRNIGTPEQLHAITELPDNLPLMGIS